MIKKENFVRIMDSLRIQHDQEIRFGETFQEFFDGHIVFKLNGHIYDRVQGALSDELDDTEEWLSWWMWETDFGRSESNYYAIANDVRYELTDAGMLYDFLTMDQE